MTPVGISGLISNMCPLIPSDLPEGIPYSMGVALCSHGNGTGARPAVRQCGAVVGIHPLGCREPQGCPGLPSELRARAEPSERGSRSRLRDLLASGFPSKCLKRQRLVIKKELLCGGILRRLCKFLHLEAVCLSPLWIPLSSW